MPFKRRRDRTDEQHVRRFAIGIMIVVPLLVIAGVFGLKYEEQTCVHAHGHGPYSYKKDFCHCLAK